MAYTQIQNAHIHTYIHTIHTYIQNKIITVSGEVEYEKLDSLDFSGFYSGLSGISFDEERFKYSNSINNNYNNNNNKNKNNRNDLLTKPTISLNNNNMLNILSYQIAELNSNKPW